MKGNSAGSCGRAVSDQNVSSVPILDSNEATVDMTKSDSNDANIEATTAFCCLLPK